MGAAARERNARCRPPDRPQQAVASETVCAPIRANDALPREKKLADGRFAQRTAEVHRAVRRERQDSLTRSVQWVTPVRPVPLRAPDGLSRVSAVRREAHRARRSAGPSGPPLLTKGPRTRAFRLVEPGAKGAPWYHRGSKFRRDDEGCSIRRARWALPRAEPPDSWLLDLGLRMALARVQAVTSRR